MLVTGVHVLLAEVGSLDATSSQGADSAASVADTVALSRASLFSTVCCKSVSFALEIAICSPSDGRGAISAPSSDSAVFKLSTSSGLTA